MKTPFLVAGAGLERRGVKDTRSLVSGMDVLPTMCDYTGVPPPASMGRLSLRPAIQGVGLDGSSW